MVCLTTVALGLLAVPTIVWLVTYFGESCWQHVPPWTAVFVETSLCIFEEVVIQACWAPSDQPTERPASESRAVASRRATDIGFYGRLGVPVL